VQLYKYLTGGNDPTFWQRVTAQLNRGWKLHGSPTLAFDSVKNKVICGQALVREVPGQYSDVVNPADY
jgi:hypothetical protein